MKFKNFFAVLFFCCAVTTIFADSTNELFMNCFKKAQSLKQQGISYDLYSASGKKKKNAVAATVYMKGDKMRMETPDGVSIIDITKNVMYICSDRDKTAIKMALNMDQVKQASAEVSQEKADELIYLKDDSKNGYACKVFKAKDGKKDVEYYMTNDYGFPTYIKEAKSESNITNFKVGSIKNNLFEVPASYKILNMGNISALSDEVNKDVNKKVSKGKSNVSEKAKGYAKDTANDTVVGGIKEGVNEVSSEQKSKIKEETKEKTKKALKGFLGI